MKFDVFICVLSIVLFIGFLFFCASNDAKRAKRDMERLIKIERLQFELDKVTLEKHRLECKVCEGKTK